MHTKHHTLLIIGLTISGLISTFIHVSKGEKILFLSFLASQSHKNVYDPLVRELINRNHSITIVSPVKSPFPADKVREINGMTMSEFKGENAEEAPIQNFFTTRVNKVNVHLLGSILTNIFVGVCKSYYEMEEIKALQHEKFDLVIVSSIINECAYGLVHKLNTTFIFTHTHSPEPWKTAFTGVAVPPSFVPMFHVGGSDEMSYQTRVINFFTQIQDYFWYHYVVNPQLEAVYRHYLGNDVPSVWEIEKKASLILMNRHFSLQYPKPGMPQMIEVGGMHCRPGEPLPKDLSDFIESSGNEGFIYFSMGSVVQASTMPEEFRKILVKVFSQLKQKVIWKWETETMPDLPKNVLLRKWLPQQDILAHPKIRMFISHGGLLSTEEAVYHAVPLIGIPMFGDQDWNMKQAEQRGFALSLEFAQLSEQKLLASINLVLNDSTFSQRIKQLSVIFKDRPQRPLDTAVYWTEYIMRHKGAHHLRSPGADLNFFQYFSIDVLLPALIVVYIVSYTVLALCKVICCAKNKERKFSKKND